jgi:hypothetical protein
MVLKIDMRIGSPSGLVDVTVPYRTLTPSAHARIYGSLDAPPLHVSYALAVAGFSHEPRRGQRIAFPSPYDGGLV